MDIEKIREKKHELEENITNLLTEFQKETDTNVVSISVRTIDISSFSKLDEITRATITVII